MVKTIYLLFVVEYFILAFLLWKLTAKKYSKRQLIFLNLIFFLIFISRMYKFNSVLGLDMDEAMGAVNSWSLGKYGVDYFNLVHNPIYLFAWGSGMNILYPLLTVPFIKMFGLSMVIYRSPMIFLSILSVFVFTVALVKYNLSIKKISILIMILFLSPWSFQASRWAIESNLFPIMMLFSTAFLLLYLSEHQGTKKEIYYFCFIIFISLSAYTYSNNWMFLGLFVLLIFGYLRYKKLVTLKYTVLGALVMLVIVLPLLVFLIINFTGRDSVTILGITIPKLAATRSVFMVHYGEIIKDLTAQLKYVTSLFITGYDGLAKQGLPTWGAFYPLMITFFFVGIIKLKGKLDEFTTIMLIMLISGGINILLIEPNWLHFNALMLPVLYFEYLGVVTVFDRKYELLSYVSIFLVCFVLCFHSYANNYQTLFQNGGQNTSAGLGELIQEANHHYKNIYLMTDGKKTNSGAMFILPIFYNQINPYYFHEQTKNVKHEEFMTYRNYGKWHIIQAEQQHKRIVSKSKDSAFIVQKEVKKSLLPKHVVLKKNTNYYYLYELK